ncbi:hypothetical protein M422DRAFT_42738 [Sphaerobolus stellatus SS14]|nr:hypothetical protein M422DRAFT_42738 [Sphaerobolus stellatus SS14]
MEHDQCNPFVPRATIIRFPNGIFELRLHLHGIVSAVEVVPHDNYVLIRGYLVPRARRDCQGLVSSITWSDTPCGVFSRDIPLRLSPNTLLQILERRQDCDDYVIRYTLRNGVSPVRTCAHLAQLDAFSTKPCKCGIARDPCGSAIYTGSATGGKACGCGSGAVGGVAGGSYGVALDTHTGVHTSSVAPTANAPVQTAEGFAIQQI